MTIAVVRTRSMRRCVRCGLLPPAPELFICGRCADDPETVYERRIIEELVVGADEQRAALVKTFDWYGGWWAAWRERSV